jgi:hypothetical protein
MDVRLWLGPNAYQSIKPSIISREEFVCFRKYFDPLTKEDGATLDVIHFNYSTDPSSRQLGNKGFDMEYTFHRNIGPFCDFGTEDMATFHPSLAESAPLKSIPDPDISSLLAELDRCQEEKGVSSLIGRLWDEREKMKKILNRCTPYHTATHIVNRGNYLIVTLAD